jgi:hypothetical protein
MGRDASIDVALLRELVELDEATGRLFWRPREARHFKGTDRRTPESFAAHWNGKWAGREAFTKEMTNGYRGGVVLGVNTYAHRVAFALANGSWPTGEIDHLNRDKTDNRPLNLRDVPKSTNQKNRPMQRNNTSGFNGVSRDTRSGAWFAFIKVDGRARRIGTFPTRQAAIAARREANAAHGFHETHGDAP